MPRRHGWRWGLKRTQERKLNQLQEEMVMVENSFSHCLKELQLRDITQLEGQLAGVKEQKDLRLTQLGVGAMHFPTPYTGTQGFTTPILTTDTTQWRSMWRQLFPPLDMGVPKVNTQAGSPITVYIPCLPKIPRHPAQRMLSACGKGYPVTAKGSL